MNRLDGPIGRFMGRTRNLIAAAALAALVCAAAIVSCVAPHG